MRLRSIIKPSRTTHNLLRIIIVTTYLLYYNNKFKDATTRSVYKSRRIRAQTAICSRDALQSMAFRCMHWCAAAHHSTASRSYVHH